MTSLRRQDDWFASYYRELTANPFNGRFGSTRTLWRKLNQFGVFDYDSITRQISKNDSVATHHIISAGKMREAGGSIPWVSSILGIEGSPNIEFDVPSINDSFSDAIAANILLLKRLDMGRARASNVFKSVTSNTALKSSSFELISSSDMDEFRLLFDEKLQAFDATYPNETRPKKAQTRAPQVIELDPSIIENFEFSRLKTVEALRNELNLSKATLTDMSHMGGELHYMKNSVSWRITKPLRNIMTLYRALQNR